MAELKFNKDERKFLVKCLENYSDNLKETKRLIKKIEKSMKPIKVSTAKGKGRSLQYWVCEQLAKIFNVDYVQSDDNCKIHSREMGQHGIDVILRDELYNHFRYDIECKAQESLYITDWIEQAKANKKIDRDWLLVVKKQSVGEPFVVMSWDAFMRLYQESGSYQDLWVKAEG